MRLSLYKKTCQSQNVLQTLKPLVLMMICLLTIKLNSISFSLIYHQITWGKRNRNSFLYLISWHLPQIWQQWSFLTLKKKRRLWRYQRGNQIPYIEEEQTTQWPKEKKYKRTNNDLLTRTPLKTGCELWCFGRVSSS